MTRDDFTPEENGAVIPEVAADREELSAGDIPGSIGITEYNSVPMIPEVTAFPDAAVKAERLSDREVMEHTASVWRYKSINDDGTEQHTEYHEKRSSSRCADVIGARVRGKKHKHEGTNCDDYFETALTDDFSVCVVCDGAGSKPLSRIGSRASCETACGFIKEELSSYFAEENFRESLCADMTGDDFMMGAGRVAALVQESARKALAAVVREYEAVKKNRIYTDSLGREPVLPDLSSTFLAAVIIPLTIGGERQVLMASVQIGDGCICAIDSKKDAEHCLRLMGTADSGAYSGETDFLSERNTRAEVIGGKTRVSRGTSDTVLMMTDGVADDYFPAQPMMKRLYLDLCLNGILPMEGEYSFAEDPAPIRYRSVSLSQQSVALQYAKQLMPDGSVDAANALWDKRCALKCHSLEAFRMNIGNTPEERLRVWLDNYNERGSFDDRTLVAVKLT